MKNYFLLSAVSAMMLAACSDDKVPLEAPEVAQSGQEITLTLSSGGDGISTRVSRPVYSSEAANNVNLVRLYVYDPDGVDVTSAALTAGTQNPIVWNAGPSTPGIPGTTEHKASQTVKLNKLSTDGDYTIVAYGYNVAPDYTISGGGSGFEAFTATIPALGNESEFFAGKNTFTIVNGNVVQGTTNEVVLKRHVAGLLAYFKNIPILYTSPTTGLPVPVAFVRVYASSHANAFTFPSALLVNGTGNGTKTKVLEFSLASLVADLPAQVLAAGTDLAKTINIPAGTGSAVTVANSVLGGKFLVPFSKVASATTFTVQLEDLAGNMLKKWDIVNNASTDKKVYDVNRNYFYSIGQKIKATSTDGGTPGTPTTDDDQPIDLSLETVINVTVNDAWDMIYNLGLE